MHACAFYLIRFSHSQYSQFSHIPYVALLFSLISTNKETKFSWLLYAIFFRLIFCSFYQNKSVTNLSTKQQIRHQFLFIHVAAIPNQKPRIVYKNWNKTNWAEKLNNINSLNGNERHAAMPQKLVLNINIYILYIFICSLSLQFPSHTLSSMSFFFIGNIYCDRI